ncbi:MAG TPA: nucleotidyltransferase family protein [Stenomitos sp.]
MLCPIAIENIQSDMLLHTALKLALKSPHSPDVDWQPVFHTAKDRDWQILLSDLELHRLQPLMFYAFKLHGCVRDMPKFVLQKLMAAYFFSLQRNTILFQSLTTALEPIYEMSIYPVLWKGVVLADQLYPNVATRMIGDIDWAIAPYELTSTCNVLERLGFTCQASMTTSDAVYYKSPDQILLDIHHRVRLFEGKEHLQITQTIQPHSKILPELHILEANAMLVHLTVHLLGHRSEKGLLLFWILDFVFLLRKWGHHLDWDILNALIPDSATWQFLGELLHFLQVELEEPLPSMFHPLVRAHRPLTLAAITRQCRLAPWGLPRPKGWFKLAACRVGLQTHKHRYPQFSDLLLWMTDLKWETGRLQSALSEH